MSPKTGVSIDIRGAIDGERRTPRMKVVAAVAQARGTGLPLRFGDAGVERGEFSPAWKVDRKAIPGGVSLAGAVLLALQPESSPDEDTGAVLARALGVPLAFAEGLGDGWDMVAMSTYWTGGEASQHYVNGFELGAEVRFMATMVCSTCSTRRFKGDGDRCPGCDR
jgi:hypothetical protein